MPISEDDKLSDSYTKGVSCPRCIEVLDDTARERFIQRQLQVDLAQERGQVHLGDDVEAAIHSGRAANQAIKSAARQQAGRDPSKAIKNG